MAVTIDEMHVDVNEATPQPAAPSSAGQPGGSVDLRTAIAIIHERELRLRAD